MTLSRDRSPSRKILQCLLIVWMSALTHPAQAGAGNEPDQPAKKTAVVGSASPEKLPIDRGLNQPLSLSVKLTNTKGKPFSFRYLIGKRAIVIIFIGTECPVGNVYMPTIVQLAKDYQSKNVQFLLINSNASETLEQVAAHAAEYGLDKVGPQLVVLKDSGSELADLALAERTNETIIIDPTLDFQKMARIRYRGAIDDQYTVRGRKPEATKHHLKTAIDEFLAGKPLSAPATEVAGCLIERAKPRFLQVDNIVRPAPKDIAEHFQAVDKDALQSLGQRKFTYAEDIAAILQAKCQNCHRPNQVAPFPLLTYADAKRWSATLREVVSERRMPPWHADPRHGVFSNDRSLTPEERAKILAWVDQGALPGDAAKEPAKTAFTEGWTIRKPDMVLELPQEHIVPAGGVVDYVRYFLPDPIDKDYWVKEVQARPGDAKVVHHIIVYYIMPNDGRPRYLVGYAPGDLSEHYPPGYAKRLPKGSRLFFEMHYTPIGTVRKDRSSVGLVFTDEPVKKEVITMGIESREFSGRDIVIPAGNGNFPITSSRTFNRNVELMGMMPHMHLRGKAFQYEHVDASGKRNTLLSVPAYDFGWQSFYWLDKPLKIAKGERIDCLAHFDNSANNPYNPDANAEVRWGDQTFEEMMIGFIEFAVDADAPPEPANPNARPANRARLLQRLFNNDNNDGAKKNANDGKEEPKTTPSATAKKP